MVLDILALGIVAIGCFYVGYLSGTKGNAKHDIEQIVKSIKQGATKVGPVTRPSAEKVNEWTHPKQVEEDEEFKRSFTKDIGDPTK